MNYQNKTKEEIINELEGLNNHFKDAQAQIYESENRHKFLFDRTLIGVVYQNANGEIIEANQAAERILGLTLDQMQGLTSIDPRWKAIHEDGSDFPGETHPATVTLHTGQPVYDVIMGVYNPQRGDHNWININSFPRFEKENNKIKEVIITFEDITNRIKSESEIKAFTESHERNVDERTSQLNLVIKELESFAYSVSHDLRTPLRTINEFSYIIQSEFSNLLNEECSNYFRHIRVATQTMGQLIDSLLNLSHISKSEIIKEKTNLSEMAVSVINNLKNSSPNRNIQVEIENGIEVFGDPKFLHIAIQNLLNNAWKYTSNNESAKIEFKTMIQDKSKVYFIRDNGVGFDMIYANKLFKPFQRLHGVSEFEGSGIGLATVERIVTKHGGSIWVEAEINKGACFYFML